MNNERCKTCFGIDTPCLYLQALKDVKYMNREAARIFFAARMTNFTNAGCPNIDEAPKTSDEN